MVVYGTISSLLLLFLWSSPTSPVPWIGWTVVKGRLQECLFPSSVAVMHKDNFPGWWSFILQNIYRCIHIIQLAWFGHVGKEECQFSRSFLPTTLLSIPPLVSGPNNYAKSSSSLAFPPVEEESVCGTCMINSCHQKESVMPVFTQTSSLSLLWKDNQSGGVRIFT